MSQENKIHTQGLHQNINYDEKKKLHFPEDINPPFAIQKANLGDPI